MFGKSVESVMVVSFFCNDSFSMCHIATLMFGLGLILETCDLGLGRKVLFTSLGYGLVILVKLLMLALVRAGMVNSAWLSVHESAE